MIKERIAQGVFALFGCISILCVIMICIFLFGNAIPTLFHIGFLEFIFGLNWYPSEEIFGIFPMIIGSIYVSVLAILLGVPIGVLSAIYLSAFASKQTKYYVMPAIELLGAIPSVVYGFFGLVVIVPWISDAFNGVSGKSVLAAALILSIMILPTIILISKSALDSVPKSYYEGALALGATKERSVFFVSLLSARSGILSSIILGIGRAIGEAMAVIMVAGNQVQIPHSLIDGVRTLTTNIALEMGYATDLHREALIVNAVVLFVLILLINTSLNLVKEKP